MTSQLEKILSHALGEVPESDDDGSVKTTTVNLHLAQMKEWGVRGGNVGFKAVQDFNSIRKKFISDVIDDNFIKQRLDAAMEYLCCRGEVVWIVMPSSNNPCGYQIDYFVGGKNHPAPEYYVFYDLNDKQKIDSLVIKTSHESNMPRLYGDGSSQFLINDQPDNTYKIWFLTFFNQDKIIEFRFDQEPKNIKSYYYLYDAYIKGESNLNFTFFTPQESPNPFAPELPFVVCKNVFQKKNQSGMGDFTQVKGLIEEHNDLLLSSSDNLTTFNTPSLLSSRNAASVVEALDGDASNSELNSWAGQNGYRSVLRKRKAGFRMPKVIGGVRADERFGYIQIPQVISSDQNQYTRSLRELIHWTLGGVDPLGISASATFGEIKSLFGRIENTAMKKANSLLGENGLCKLLSLIISNEEKLCKIAVVKFLVARFSLTIELGVLQKELDDPTFKDLAFYIKDQLKIELPGLPPLGKNTCTWRYTKDVFERTARDQLDWSIVYRNNREDGISQEVALEQLFPNWKDDEIRQSMSGFSPRVVTNAMEGLGALLQLYQQLMQMPDPQNPKMPWAITLGIPELLIQGIKTLEKEMTFNIPDYNDSPDYQNLNSELTSLLQKVAQSQVNTNVNVPTAATTSATTVSSSGANNSARNGATSTTTRLGRPN